MFPDYDSAIVSFTIYRHARKPTTNSLRQESPVIPDLGVDPGELAIIEEALPKIESEIEPDIVNYAASIAKEPDFLSAAAALATAIPSSVQEQIVNDPSEFVVSLVTATQYPPWVSAIPTDAQSYLRSIGEHFASFGEDIASIIDEVAQDSQPTPVRGSFVFPTGGFVIPTGVYPKGTAGFPRPTGTGVLPSGTGHISGTGRPSGTSFVTGVYPTATGTGAGEIPSGGINGTVPTPVQASPPPFAFDNGASSPLKRTGSAGAAAALIGAACWLLA